MFYSPTKEFVRFNTYRTAEIKALKERIQKEKVTPDQILSTQSRLEKLKKTYDLLREENHAGLKECLQNSESSISELQQERAVKSKEAAIKQQQIEDMEQHKMELQEKGELIEEALRREVREKELLLQTKTQNDEHLLLLDKEYGDLQREVANQASIKQDVGKAEAEINKKWDEYWKQLEACRLLKQDLTQQVYYSRDEGQRLKAEWQITQKDIQKLEVLIEKGKVTQQLCKSKSTALAAMKLKDKEYTWMLVEEKEKEATVESILKNIAEDTWKVERDELTCQKKVKETLIKIDEEEAKKTKLIEKITLAKSNLKVLKEKNDNLKTKMNSIFKNDCQLIKTIANKKVYPNCRAETIEIVKKSVAQPIDTKENVSTPLTVKTSKIESILEQRPFGELNRIV